MIKSVLLRTFLFYPKMAGALSAAAINNLKEDNNGKTTFYI